MEDKVIHERRTGSRVIACTEFPVLDQLVRGPGRRPTWHVVRGLCNGVPQSAKEFKTLRAASAEYWGMDRNLQDQIDSFITHQDAEGAEISKRWDEDHGRDI